MQTYELHKTRILLTAPLSQQRQKKELNYMYDTTQNSSYFIRLCIVGP